MIDLKKIYEDAVMAASAGNATSGEISTPSSAVDNDLVKGGMTTDDVLGKECDHHKHGYLGPGCFHVPSKACKMFKREILAGKKKKKQKNDYAKGMTVIGEADLDRETILAIHSIPEEDIVEFIKKYDQNAQYVDAIAYWPIDKLYFIKYNIGGASRYVIADFDGMKFVDAKDMQKRTYDGKEVKAMYKFNGTKENVWIVYSYEE